MAAQILFIFKRLKGILVAIKKDAVLRIIFETAECYEKNLKNKNLLFIYEDKHHEIDYYEVVFEASNFLHLTGLKVDKSKLSAQVFYQRCLAKRLSVSDFEIAPDGTTELKLDVLPQLVRKNLSARMIGDFSSNGVKLYTERIAGNVHACVGFVTDQNGRKNVPNTILKEDVRNITKRANRIVLTYRKSKEDELYSEMVYSTKNYAWDKIKLPKGCEYLPLPSR